MSAEAAAENNIYLMFPLSATATTTTAKQLGNVCASLESKCTQTKGGGGAGGVQFSRICLGMQ